MRRTRLSSVLLLVCALALVAVMPAATASASQPASAAKKCRKGYKRVRVKRRGHVRVVCRKVKKAKRTTAPAPGTSTSTATPAPSATSAPAGPTVAEVEAIIRGGLQAQHQSWLGPESIEVIFERPTQVLSSVQYDPYGNDPLHAGGPIEAWPVRAWVKYISHQDATPEDDTRYTGCDAHLDQTWPHDSLYMFFRSAAGNWDFRSTSAKPGDC